jgi:lipoprotein-anchoring transpeptidase ErfK/SrfK
MQPQRSSGLIRYAQAFCFSVVLVLTNENPWSLLSTYNANLSKTNALLVAKGTTITTHKKIPTHRWIEIILSKQRLLAREGKNTAYSYRISTGKQSTPTPIGHYSIYTKYRINRMRGKGYDIPDVPYVMYFYGGYAIHGAYWHRRFGTRVTHGCINLPVGQAHKLYNWATIGTQVVIHK